MEGCLAGKTLINYDMKNLKLNGFNTENNTFIIAEIGINHNGDINLAKKLIKSAARAGVDAVKFQTYLTEKRVPKDSSIFNILKKCELPFESFLELKLYSEKLNVEFFSTPFDNESVDFLKSIDISLFKIASFDIVNIKLLEKIAKTNKPIILSVGMSNFSEINKAYKTIRSFNDKIALLHCVSSYPTNENDSNISVINKLKESFDCIIGQSDHTNDIQVPLYSVCCGAQILEKHFMIDETMDCVDAPVSITERQMKKLVYETRRIEKIMGSPVLETRECEKGSLIFRRKS
jgi:sialic acid synthase SpsE